MKTKILIVDKDNIDENIIIEGANIIKDNGLVAFPTETVYGLGANGLEENAVEKIFRAKGRPQDNPLILHVNSIEQIKTLVEDIPQLAYKSIEKFWPGPLTIILKKSPIVPDIITGGLDTVALRMPNHPIALKLIEEAGVPIAAPSANISGRPSPTAAEHVIEDLKGKVDMIIDGGQTGIGLESTVIDLSVEPPIILRPGGITLEDLREVIPNIIQDKSIIEEDMVPKSPGQKYKHYAPKAEMILIVGDLDNMVNEIKNQYNFYKEQGKRIGIMATDETLNKYDGEIVISLGSRLNKETIAHNLFNTIRLFDEAKVDIILAEGVESSYIGVAIMNRMIKAASSRVIRV